MVKKTLPEHAVDHQMMVDTLEARIMSDKEEAFRKTVSGMTYPGTLTVSAVDNIAREAWLEKTQNMRVVALNEACALFKDAKLSPGPQNVLAYARAFADFLVDGKS